MRRWIFGSLLVMIVAAAGLVGANLWVVSASRDYVYDDVARIPARDVGLVLGTSPFTRTGQPNALFQHRMQAAAELYQAGKVAHLLLSGANPDATYNEPRKMYQALRAAGVPDSAMTMDFAGFRTLDSIVRARRVFGLQRFTIVSQRFHDFRAVFIARHSGIDAIAFTHPDEDRWQPARTEGREFLARAVAVADIFVFGSRPRFLGQRARLDIRPRKTMVVGDKPASESTSDDPG